MPRPTKRRLLQVGERVEVEIGQAQRQRGEHRQEEEHADDEQRRRDERPGGALRSHGARPCRSIQRRFSRIVVGPRVERAHTPRRPSSRRRDDALGGEAHFLRDALPLGHFRRRAYAFELRRNAFAYGDDASVEDCHVARRGGMLPDSSWKRCCTGERDRYSITAHVAGLLRE